MAQRTPADRFWSKVQQTEACWIWTGCRNEFGYGGFRFDGKRVKAHRFSYELLVGPIPGNLDLDHLCRNRACVNPKHLEPVTRRGNVLRGVGPTAVNAAKTHCQKGHPYDDSNTSRLRRGRRCLACHREEGRARRARAKVAAGG